MQEYAWILMEILYEDIVGLFNLQYYYLLELYIVCNKLFLPAGW